MGLGRFAAVVAVTLLCAEAPLQQPPRDGLRTPPSAAQLATEAHDLYKEGRWQAAAQKYEAALAGRADLPGAYFFLANCYDNLYRPSAAGQPANDAYLQKAVENYRLASGRDPDPRMKKLAMEYLVAAYGPEKMNDPSRAEPIVQRMIDLNPGDPSNYAVLAKLLEDTGRYDDAEAALLRAGEVAPQDPLIRKQLAGFYNRQGNFEKTMDALQGAAELDSANPEAHQLVATYYWEKGYKDHRLPKATRLEYIEKGIAATDRALALNADHVDALTYKNLLLRMRANEEPDPAIRANLLGEADALLHRAMELSRAPRGRGRGGASRQR